MQHLETCLLLAETDGVLKLCCKAFNCLFLLNAQNEIKIV